MGAEDKNTEDKDIEENIKKEIKGRLVSLLDGKFMLTLFVFLVSVFLLVNEHLGGGSFATIVTGGIFAYDITRNESYSQIISNKVKDKVKGEVNKMKN